MADCVNIAPLLSPSLAVGGVGHPVGLVKGYHIGIESTPYVNQGKGDPLCQRAVSLPHQRVRGKLVWVWWVSGSTQPQGTRIVTSVLNFNGMSGGGKSEHIAKNGHGAFVPESIPITSFESLLPTVHNKVSSAFWTMPPLPFKMK
eukprot:1153614-Pelagomonas_calceolata.AAC.3